MEVITTSAIGHYAYGTIDSNVLRNTVDGFFPSLAKNLDADFISGFHHRYKGGHDLLLDIPKTFIDKGVVDSFKHAGHVICTDFPTKAGIPIPGFSQAGLGQYLENIGLSKGWLSINIMDGAIGFIAIAEGHSDLLKAVAGNLDMNVFTFFDTFVEGSLEIALGYYSKNPLLIIGGLENIFAGVISSVKTISVYIDPLEFFGAGIFSAFLGAGLSYMLSEGNISEKIQTALIDGGKSSSIGMMFTIGSTFGFGLMCGYLSYSIGTKMAQDTNDKITKLMSIDEEQFKAFFNAICEGDKNFIENWNQINLIEIVIRDTMIIKDKLILLDSTFETIPNTTDILKNNTMYTTKTISTVMNNDLNIIKL